MTTTHRLITSRDHTLQSLAEQLIASPELREQALVGKLPHQFEHLLRVDGVTLPQVIQRAIELVNQ